MAYTAEFDTVDAEQWHQLLLEFADANIFQTWLYGATHWGANNLSHAVVKRDGEVVGLAQSVLLGAPLLGKLLAYVIFGPVYRRRGSEDSLEHLKATLAALREEYAVRRRLCLRLRFWVYDVPNESHAAILAQSGWEEARPLHRTYVLDLSGSESQLRAALDKKWRANLRKAEQCGLTVSQRNDPDAIRMFLDLHRQMRERKHFVSVFTNMLPDLFVTLPDGLRPSLFLCWRGEVPVAAAIVSVLGNRAFSMNAATGDAALELRAAYLLQWTIVRWLKEGGRCRWYDLCVGTSTPGVRQFKRGLAGARAPEIVMTEIEACGDRLTGSIVRVAGRLHELRRRLRGPWGRLRSRLPTRGRDHAPVARSAEDASARSASQPVTSSASSFRTSTRT